MDNNLFVKYLRTSNTISHLLGYLRGLSDRDLSDNPVTKIDIDNMLYYIYQNDSDIKKIEGE